MGRVSLGDAARIDPDLNLITSSKAIVGETSIDKPHAFTCIAENPALCCDGHGELVMQEELRP